MTSQCSPRSGRRAGETKKYPRNIRIPGIDIVGRLEEVFGDTEPLFRGSAIAGDDGFPFPAPFPNLHERRPGRFRAPYGLYACPPPLFGEMVSGPLWTLSSARLAAKRGLVRFGPRTPRALPRGRCPGLG